MTMGEYIKYLREGGNVYGKKWTQEELGQEFTPPVNRAAVNKWETNRVENIKRSYIQKMSELFGVSPCELMRFDDRFDSAKAAEETKAIELVQKHFGKDAVHVLQMFMELNQTGQQKVLEDLSDMTELSKYTEKRETALKNAQGISFLSTSIQDKFKMKVKM